MKYTNNGEEIVISGISGRFPESNNMEEFMDNLLEQKNMVTSNNRRFKPGMYGIPKGFGTLKEIDKFDAEVFGILPKQAEGMDPQARIALETTYEALIDAGVNPNEARGSKTGVFTAIMFHDALDLQTRQPSRINGNNGVHLFGALIPNRISYCFDWIGPSAALDTACSSSIFALHSAVKAIESGECDSAVVVGANLILTPLKSLMFNEAGMLASDYTSRSFDAKGLGYVRAEAVVSIYIQRKSLAKRSYLTILGIGNNTDGYKDFGNFYPSSSMQEDLLDEVYTLANINPEDVSYVEAHGTGTPTGDPEEIKAISRFFCLNQERKTPLLVGSVKSNMGHAESASGLCAIAKLIIIVQSGIIPANLHFEAPYYRMKSIRDHELEIVTKNTPWPGGLMGLSSFGFGGVNCHVIFKPNIETPKEFSKTKRDLVVFSGRTSDGVERSMQNILSSKDVNLKYLVNEIHKSATHADDFRAFGISMADDQDSFIEVKNVPKSANNSLWFVFNGMGSQWFGMGRSLLDENLTFCKSFELCCRALEPYNYNLKAIFTSNDPNIFMDNPTNSLVCIATIQIGILNILWELGLKPDGFIGHSLGEHVCAYADDCLTLEETIVSVYLRGKPCMEFIAENQDMEYGMAAVNMGWEEAKTHCQAGLYAVCNNGPKSTTIAGPKKLIEEFKEHVKDLKGEITVKDVQSSGLPFHSPYLEKSGERYKKLLEDYMNIIPKARSRKWISSSIIEEKKEKMKIFSGEYFYMNFQSPVYFLNAIQKIPESTTILEIGPSGLLRGLVQAGTKSCTVISLQARNEDSLLALQKGLGRLYLSGINFDINKLFNVVPQALPVPGNTPMIGHLVSWDHSESWNVPNFEKVHGSAGRDIITVDLSKTEDSYLVGHTLQKRIIYPSTGYMMMIWKYFSEMNSKEMFQFPVVFENIKIPRVTLLRHQGITEFRIALSEVTGIFEIKEGDAVVCCGKIRSAKLNEEKIVDYEDSDSEPSIENPLVQEDIYKRLRFLGYEYIGPHRGILEANLTGTEFKLSWNDNNWIAFLDTFVQTSLNIYTSKNILHDLAVPTEFTRILINPMKFYESLENSKVSHKENTVHVKYNPDTGIINCKGIEFEGIKTAKLSEKLKKEPPPVVSNYKFEPYFYRQSEIILEPEEFSPLLRCISIVMDNMSCVHDKSVYRTPNILELSMNPSLNETLAINNAIRVHFCVPEINYQIYAADMSEHMEQKFAKALINVKSYDSLAVSFDWVSIKYDLIILDSKILLSRVKSCLRSGGFLILKLSYIEKYEYDIKDILDYDDTFQVIANKISKDWEIFLIRKSTKKKSKEIHIINLNHDDAGLSWVDESRNIMLQQEELASKNEPLPRIYFLANGMPESGILGFMNCLRKEPFSSQVRSIFSTNKIALNFENPDPLLTEILEKDLVFNVFNENGTQGCYIHSEIKKHAAELVPSAYIEIERPGDLTTFKWVQGFDFKTHYSSDIFPKEYVPVDVHVVGLNFKDVMIATGNLQPEFEKTSPNFYESPLGLEFAGIIEGNRRVCGISTAQCLSTQVLVKEKFLFDIPEQWSFEDAATVPLVYSTAYLALVIRGNIRQGDSVLIHSGAGGVGIAAIRIALSYNCNVFTTVSQEKKIEFIRNTFPEIPKSNIGCSRDTRFEQMVRTGTKGRGVNLVLNSLAGDKLEASLRCLALHGRFLEIGRVDLSRNSQIGLDVFLRHISIHGIYLSALHDENEDANLVWDQLKTLVECGINNGVVQPLPYRLFNKDQIEPAFRYMGQGFHIGKVLIEIRNPKSTFPFTAPAIPQVFFNPKKSSIIIGGLGGLGHEIINWMTLKYARQIVIAGRTGSKNLKPYTLNYLEIWKDRGVTIKIMELDDKISDHRIEEIFQEAQKMGPIGGIFNLAMTLDAKLLKLQTIETYRSVLNPKVKLTKALDSYSRKHCPELEHFVIFSSISAGLGYDGQTNYGYGSSCAERIIERRRQDGLPGVGIQFGPIGDVGAWHEIYNPDYNRTSYHGSAIQSLGSVLNTIEYLLCSPITSSPTTLCRRTIEVNANENGYQLLEATLLDRLAQILGHSDASKINKKATLTELGMESVMSIEAKSVLENEFGLTLSAAGLREYTLEQLNELAQNSQNQQTLVQTQIPKLKPATAGLIQLNFLKLFPRAVDHSDVIYPVNALAKDQGANPGIKLIICNSLEAPDIFKPLGKLVKCPLYSLQLPNCLDDFNSCQEVADLYYKTLKEVIPKGPYIIAGLSAGVFPGFELSYMLEKSNEVVKCIFMDMTFDRFQSIAEENGGLTSNLSTLSDNLMVLTACQIYGFDLEMIEGLLRSEPKKDQRINRLFELISRQMGDRVDAKAFKHLFINDWRSMVKLFGKYRPSGIFNGKVGLIRTTQNLIAYDTSTSDWGLSQVCTQAPDILIVDTTHSYMIAEPAVYKLADMFNKIIIQEQESQLYPY